MDRHIGSTDIGAFLSQRERAAAIDGTEPGHCGHRGRAPAASGTASGSGPDETPPTQAGSSLRRTAEHLQTFRDAAGDLDVVYLHYDDLKAGLEGQMRQMAARLGIDVGERRWPRLVQAATFESMRSRAGTTVPGGGPEHWTDPPRSSAAARAASGAASSTTPASPGTPRACGRSRPATSSSGRIASRSTEIPARRYTRTTQS